MRTNGRVAVTGVYLLPTPLPFHKTTLESATPDHTRDDTRKAEHGDTGTRSTRVTAQESPAHARARGPVGPLTERGLAAAPPPVGLGPVSATKDRYF